MSVETLAAEVEALKKEFHELKHQVVVDFTSHIMLQQKQISCRRGDPGPKGDSVVGPAGRDAVLRVVVDGKENVIHVFGEDGTEKATIMAVPGPAGAPGQSIVGPKGDSGKDGRNAPTLSEIVAAALAEVKNRWAKL